ncbi:hypothetical protein NW809_10215 [Synechococcus sp. WC101]|uniref:hypothetical protein n=1 Tax=Synechococcus sp. WC101 TaxID=2964536 RepID=UPI0039C08589
MVWGSPPLQPSVRPLLLGTLPLILSLVLLGGCSSDAFSTVPLDGTAAGTRTATPPGRTFSDIPPGRDPLLKHLWASFVITSEQLQSARKAPISLHPQALLPCTDCESLAEQLGSLLPTPSSRALGTYRPDQLTLSFRVEPHKTFTRLSGSFHLDTTTPLVHPGEGVRLVVQQAFWGDKALEPLPPPQDFYARQMTQGRFEERTWSFPFSLPEADAPDPSPSLRLQVVLTSPIPPDSAPFQRGRPLPPPTSRLYHGVTWSGMPTWEQLLAYRQAIGQPPAWAAVEHLWDPRQDFPQPLANRLRESGSVPYLRLRLQPAHLSSLAAGEQDETLRSWARGIQRFATPIILAVAVGDGDTELQRRAYRHLIQTLRSEANLLWVLELEGADNEAVSAWAALPGVDWLSLEVKGDPETFEALYRRLVAFNPQLPLILSGPSPDAEAAQPFLEGLQAGRWLQVIGWSWALGPQGIPPAAATNWQQRLHQGDPPLWLGEMRVQPPPSPSPSPKP